MKSLTNRISMLVMAVLLGLPIFSHGQELAMTETEIDLSKEAAKHGWYAGTYLINDGGARVFYLWAKKKKRAMDVYDFSQSGEFATMEEGIEDEASLMSKFDIEIPDDGESNFKTYSDVLLLRTDLIGRLVADKGYIRPNYDDSFDPPFFTGYEFESEEKLKPDMRIMPLAFIPIGETMSDITVEGGIKRVVAGTSQETVLMGDATALVTGIVREKVSIKDPSPYNNNRLACQMISGEDLSILDENIYELPFACQPVSVGTIKNDIALLFSTLQAPNNQAEAKLLNMQGEDRKFMHYARVNDIGELVDSVRFRSNSVRGAFSMLTNDEDVYVLGFINNKHDGWYRWDAGKVTDLQITKISGGGIAYNNAISIDALEASMAIPEGEKVKFNITSNGENGSLRFNEVKPLSNGDLLFIGQSPKEYFAVQVGSDGTFKKYYQINRIDDDFIQYDLQVIDHGGNILLVIMEQPGDVTQGVHYSATRSTRRVVRVDDIYTKGRVVKLDPASMTLSNQVDIGDKKYYMVGSEPCLMKDGNDEIFITGSDRKKNLYMITLK